MLFMITAHLKPGAEARLAEFAAEFNEHLAQPFRKLRIGGVLNDRRGRRIGYMAIIEGESFEHAEAWLRESPFERANLYARTEIAEYRAEVGALG
jgi:uncharacterized protein YciI